MEEKVEDNVLPFVESDVVCKCLLDDEKIEIPARKQYLLSAIDRTETYLKQRRIPELIRFLLAKVIVQASDKPIAYLESLLNDCMLFRAGHGLAPVLFEQRRLEAIVKSFDPGQRGWMTAGQVRRAFITLDLTPIELDEEKVSTEFVLNSLKEAQEIELCSLLTAGIYC